MAQQRLYSHAVYHQTPMRQTTITEAAIIQRQQTKVNGFRPITEGE